jgi:hypothetical protein
MNILPMLTGEEVDLRNTYYFVQGRRLQAVRDGDLKLRIDGAEGMQLFNLSRDPGERINIADRHSGEVDRLTAMLIEFAEETGAEFEETE